MLEICYNKIHFLQLFPRVRNAKMHQQKKPPDTRIADGIHKEASETSGTIALISQWTRDFYEYVVFCLRLVAARPNVRLVLIVLGL